MRREDIIVYKGFNVQIAVPRIGDSLSLFWHYGQMIHLDDECCILKRGDRLVKVFLKEIIKIELDNRSR